MPLDELLGFRLFGKNKSLLGLISAFSAAVIISAFLTESLHVLDKPSYFFMGVVSGLGAIVGDLFGSILKRLLKIKEGQPFFTDQITFILFALIGLYLIDPNVLPLWLSALLLIFSAYLHRFMNVLAHYLKLKKVPW